MKISYLILAHTDPHHCGRLIAALDNGQNNFFIHVDRKVRLEQFSNAVSPSPKIMFLNKRKKVSWGGFSIVAATNLLVREALQHAEPSDYYVLLSGLDYPIKSNTAIADFLGSHAGKQYLRYIKIVDCPPLHHKIAKYRLTDLHRRIAQPIETIFNRVLPHRSFIPGLIPYFGPQWWALTHECMSYVLSFIDKNPRFVNFYRFAGIPDEMFFHTIVLNSGYLQHTDTSVTPTKWDTLETPVPEAGDHIKYIDWTLTREQPAILDERDFEQLQKSPFLFARKFTTGKSSALINRINRELL